MVPVMYVIILLFVLLGSGLYVAFSLGICGTIINEFLAGSGKLTGVIIFNALNSYTLSAIPLFIFLGNIILQGGLSTRLYRGVAKWTRVIPGGLIQCNVLSSAFFAAISGSSVATAATMGTVAFEEQIKRGYNSTVVAGSLAGAGTLGQLIPPSMIMIVYGALCGVSVGHLFIAGVIPGIILATMFMCYVFVHNLVMPSLAPPRERITRDYWPQAIGALGDIWPMIMIFLLIFGGIYGGIFTPTEAAAASCFIAVMASAVFRELNWTNLKKAALSTARTTAYIWAIFIGGNILSYSFAFMGIPAALSKMVVYSGLSPFTIWMLLIVMYAILGCFIEGLAMLVLTLPVTYPIMVQTLGFDPIWFGILVTITNELSLITPPVGMIIYVMQGITGLSLGKISKGVIPYVILTLVAVVLYTFFPNLVTFLPKTMFGR